MRFPLSRFKVLENSMVPAFRPGDNVLTCRLPSYKAGDVIVFVRGNKNYIKRIKKVSGNLYDVSGDNRLESTATAPVAKEEICGKVIFKY